MSTSTLSHPFVCEQCGHPVVFSKHGAGCLHCLLKNAISSDARPERPNHERHTYQHYEILHREDGSLWELGRNAVSVTYKARDMNLDMVVALKVLNPDLSQQPEARATFLRQAQAMAQIRHPNVANILQFGQVKNTLAATADSHGECFYAMEFVDGETIEARVARVGPLSPQMATKVALDIASALAIAETLGVLEYNVTPSGIMLDNWVATNFARAGAEFATQLSARIINLRLTNCNEVKSEHSEQVKHSTHGIHSLGVTLLFSLIGPSALSIDRNKKLPTRKLKALKVPASVIKMLKAIFSGDRNSQGIRVAECLITLQVCLSEMTDIHTLKTKLITERHIVVVGVTAVLALCLVYFARPGRLSEKSIAILPFRNVSNNPNDSFFIEELADDIRTRLVKINEIKLINRSDESIYPGNERRDFRAIGRRLGVRFLVEGSLRSDKEQLLFHVSLVDAESSHEVWSREYRHRLADAFNLHGELASDVANALKVKLGVSESTRVSGRSTESPDAYVLYLQGRQLERNPASSVSSYEGAEAFYRQAVTLDPEYALAHARLAIMAAALYRFRSPGDELRMLSESEANKALALSPNLGEAHLAMGLYHYRIKRDFASALAELDTAQHFLPNDGEVSATRAYIHRRQARWREARSEQAEALTRDPVNQDYERELQVTACLLRDWRSASEHAAHAVLLASKLPHLQGEKALVAYWRDGDLKPLRSFFESLVGFGDEEGNLTWSRWDASLLSREFTDALAALQRFPRDTLPSVGSGPIPKTYLEGCTHLAEGDEQRANRFFEKARPIFEAETITNPNDALRHARLGLLYAYMGRKEDALREGERAVEITPVSEDAVEGHQWLCNLALIHARLGDADRALGMIESLLRQPGCVSPLNEACMTLWDLRLRWQWDPLRNDPRFQKILTGPEPETVY